MMKNISKGRVTTASVLRELVPEPEYGTTPLTKIRKEIDSHIAEFIRYCPFVTLATSNFRGECDSSPRGGEPGFIKVLDKKHLLLGEASGNRRTDSILNALDNPHVGMLFLIPGYEESLRLNGKAFITSDREILSQCELVNGYAPTLGWVIEVQECYLHCAKAILRSSLWNPLGWPDLENLPSAADMAKAYLKSKSTDFPSK